MGVEESHLLCISSESTLLFHFSQFESETLHGLWRGAVPFLAVVWDDGAAAVVVWKMMMKLDILLALWMNWLMMIVKSSFSG